MKRIKATFLAILLLLTALWLAADTLAPAPFTYFSFRTVFMQYSEVLGIELNERRHAAGAASKTAGTASGWAEQDVSPTQARRLG